MSIDVFDLLDTLEVERMIAIGCPAGFQEVCDFFEEINQPFFILPFSATGENDISMMVIFHPEHQFIKHILKF